MGKQHITLELPYPPTTNRYWRTVQGRMIISREGRAYRKQIADELLRLRLEHGPIGLGTQRLSVEIDAYPPDARRRDLDNLLKPLIDALEHARVFINDSQIDALIVRRRSSVAGGMVRVSVTAINRVEVIADG